MVLCATLFTDLSVAFYAVAGQTSFIIYNELLVKTLQENTYRSCATHRTRPFFAFSAIARHRSFTMYNE